MVKNECEREDAKITKEDAKKTRNFNGFFVFFAFASRFWCLRVRISSLRKPNTVKFLLGQAR